MPLFTTGACLGLGLQLSSYVCAKFRQQIFPIWAEPQNADAEKNLMLSKTCEKDHHLCPSHNAHRGDGGDGAHGVRFLGPRPPSEAVRPSCTNMTTCMYVACGAHLLPGWRRYQIIRLGGRGNEVRETYGISSQRRPGRGSSINLPIVHASPTL